jgi:hypothetical protein
LKAPLREYDRQDLGRHQTGVLLAQIVVGRLTDPGLAAYLADRRPVFSLLQDERNLPLTEPGFLHATNLLAGSGQT